MFEQLLTTFSTLKPLTMRVAFVGAILSGLLLFLPLEALSYLELKQFVSSSRTSIAFLFIFSICALTSELFFAIYKGLARWWKKNRYRRYLRYQLSQLSSDEKELLKKFINEDRSTFHFALSAGIARSLEAKQILMRSSNLGVPGSGDSFPFMIQPEARKIILHTPTLLS